MQQLTYVGATTLAWWDVPEPVLGGPGEALVRPFTAARCDGDALFLRHDYQKLIRAGAALHLLDSDFRSARTDLFRGPFPYGHECVAEVVALGAEVRGLAPTTS